MDVLARGGSQSPTPPDQWKLDGPTGDERARCAYYGKYDLLQARQHYKNDSDDFRVTLTLR
jgi:hypothetical protein